MKRLSLAVLVIALVFVVSGLVFADNNHTFVDIDMGNIDSLDPHFQYDSASAEIVANVYEIYQFKPGSLTEFEPLLATEVPTVENGLIKNGGKTYIFPIREGVQFHNGNELTPGRCKI